MKIRIPRQDFLEAVNKVKTVVSTKSALPILSHILMEAGEGSVRLAATDLKVSVECLVDCTVDESGSLTVSPAVAFGGAPSWPSAVAARGRTRPVAAVKRKVRRFTANLLIRVGACIHPRRLS